MLGLGVNDDLDAPGFALHGDFVEGIAELLWRKIAFCERLDNCWAAACGSAWTLASLVLHRNHRVWTLTCLIARTSPSAIKSTVFSVPSRHDSISVSLVTEASITWAFSAVLLD